MLAWHDGILKSCLFVLNQLISVLNFKFSILHSPSSFLKSPLTILNSPSSTLVPPTSIKSTGCLIQNILNLVTILYKISSKQRDFGQNVRKRRLRPLRHLRRLRRLQLFPGLVLNSIKSFLGCLGWLTIVYDSLGQGFKIVGDTLLGWFAMISKDSCLRQYDIVVSKSMILVNSLVTLQCLVISPKFLSFCSCVGWGIVGWCGVGGGCKKS